MGKFADMEQAVYHEFKKVETSWQGPQSVGAVVEYHLQKAYGPDASRCLIGGYADGASDLRLV